MFSGSDFSAVGWSIVALQTAGIICACFVRFAAPARFLRSGHALYFGLLALMAVATLVALSISPTAWFHSSAALGVMVLVALVDFGEPQRAPVKS
jgi:hypothetical protein